MPTTTNAAPPPSDQRGLRGYLYEADGHDREVSVDASLVSRLDRRSLLWIDLTACNEDDLGALAELLELSDATVSQLLDPRPKLRIDNYGGYLQFAVLESPEPRPGPDGDEPEHDEVHADDAHARRAEQRGRVDMLVGDNWLVTSHTHEAAFLRGFLHQDKAETRIGGLTAPVLAASLLDWHLEGFFAAVARIELAVDDLDHRLLAEPSSGDVLERIMAIRRRTSRLRRTLMDQRSVFYGLGRPDIAEGRAAEAFSTLASRFERAVDEVEHLRDLVVGSFELFTSRASQQTNELVKALTFFTVIVGSAAAIAGIFGMNFDPPFFQSGSVGFFAVTLGLVAVSGLAWVFAKRRQWV